MKDIRNDEDWVNRCRSEGMLPEYTGKKSAGVIIVSEDLNVAAAM